MGGLQVQLRNKNPGFPPAGKNTGFLFEEEIKESPKGEETLEAGSVNNSGIHNRRFLEGVTRTGSPVQKRGCLRNPKKW